MQDGFAYGTRKERRKGRERGRGEEETGAISGGVAGSGSS